MGGAGTSSPSSRRAANRLTRAALEGAFVFSAVGLALSALGVARSHYPLLGAPELAALCAAWTALWALWGVAAGALAGTVSLALARRRAVIVSRTGLVAALSLLVGTSLARGHSVWDALGPPVPLAPQLSATNLATAPNLVLISIDTLRADHLGVYGYGRPTSPQIDGWAEGGTLFEYAIAQAPETRRSMAALLSGLYPHVFDYERHLRGKTGPIIGAGFDLVAERLQRAGYRTAGFVANPVLDGSNGYSQGFEVWDDQTGVVGSEPERMASDVFDVVDPAIAWLEHAQSPFLLLVHVMDPHHPYRPAISGAWEVQDEPWRTDLRRSWESLELGDDSARMKELRSGEREFAPRELEYLVDRYDSEILQTDAGVAKLLAALRARGFDDRNTIVVLTADHGEEFWDHGGLLHGHTFYDELIRVPLVVRGPGVSQGQRVSEQVRVFDVAATLLEMAGLEARGLDAESLGPFLRGEGRGGADRPALSFRGERYVALRTQSRKLVAAFEPYSASLPSSIGPATLIPFTSRAILGKKRDEVGYWDLVADPGERRSLLSERRDLARDAYGELMAARDSSPLRRVDLAREEGVSEQTVEALRALGYVE